MRTRTTGLATPITGKEFAQWIHPFETPSAATTAFLRQRHQHYLSVDESHTNVERNVGIAVSGGVDSMALTTLLARHYSLLNGKNARTRTRLHAFIVDHKLRENSTEEANYVAQQVQKLGVFPHVLTLDWSKAHSLELNPYTNNNRDSRLTLQKPDKTHLETQARLRRYKAIAQQCHNFAIKDLFVGHHAGDQVETTVFRFSRASGIDGLAGIQSLAPLGVLAVPEALDIRVVRPLLQVSKDRLQATCEEAGTLWVEDPSNRSLDYQRNVIRHYQQHQDSLTVMTSDCQDSGAHPLSTASMLAFRDRMDQHRQVAWMQVAPWIKNIWFDNANGACHLKLGSTLKTTCTESESLNVDWLQDSQNHVSTRLLSFLVRWVNSKDHNPRLEDIQLLQQHLRQQQRQCMAPGLASPTVLPSLTSNPSTSTSPTVYRKLKQRASSRTSITQDHYQLKQEKQGCSESPEVSRTFVKTPVIIAGVMFSPPRKTKGVPDHWTVSRQPMSHADQISATVSVPLEGGLDVLWDQRFFLRKVWSKNSLPPSALSVLSVPSEERVLIRPLSAKDVYVVRRRLLLKGQSGVQLQQDHEQDVKGLKRLDQWLSTVPRNSRYAIPVILSQSSSPLPYSQAGDDDKEGIASAKSSTTAAILSLPTLGIHFGPTTFTFQSRLKSISPTGTKDISQFSYKI